ncbi:MAG: hypothetical protein B6229_03250 [Spirochaetaceae bacterium 4572_7]|nr:MAG: hypothetical protein B6229_03250 [Spirochaetaceae bacterium 4572_7]
MSREVVKLTPEEEAKLCLTNSIWINKSLIKGWKSNKKYLVAHGGRGSAKSMGAGALCILYMITHPNSRVLAIRGTQNKISESSLQVLKDVIRIMDLNDSFIITENTLRCVNGGEFLFYGAKNPHTFKSLQSINLVWVDEAIELQRKAWDILIPTIREKGSRFIITFNAEEEDDYVYDEFIKQNNPQAYVVKMNYWNNPYFDETDLRVDMEYDRDRDELKYLHVWEGELRAEIEGAVWNKKMIKYCSTNERAKIELTGYDKVVVSIDPSVTAKITSDACGLVVAGKIGNDYYIIDDKTAIMTPKSWAQKAVDLYYLHDADYITYESNQGGDLIKTLINNIDPSIRCISVHARRGKRIRAEEVVYLYENEQVKHIRPFKTLEHEMLTFTGEKTEKSPNALDAMVYALKDLSPSRYKVPSGLTPVKMGTFVNKVGTMRPRTQWK